MPRSLRVILIIDYQVGNLGSIANIVRKIGGGAPVVSADPAEIARASKLILPGVGAFDHGARRLREAGLERPLREAVLERKVPILGICLGMQLMTSGSEEGTETGLGWIGGHVVRFGSGIPHWSLRVPHMGWNTVTVRSADPLFSEMYAEPRFYFVHSYHVLCSDQRLVTATSHYGHEFVSAFRSGNIYGVQFHPEKSHKFGMRLLDNFLRHA